MAKSTIQRDRIPAPKTTQAQRRRLATGGTLTVRSSPGVIPEEDKPIIKRLQARWDYAKQQKDPITEQGRIDIDYLCGKTWTKEEEKARVGRLTLEFDQLNQYRNQLVNSVRQNPIAIKITPEGNGANDKTAQIRADRIRQIEYLSNAQEAYTAAFEGACDRSYGYACIEAEWEPKGFKQRLRIKAIPNPDQVLEDPDARSITGADWKYLFYWYDMSREEFNRDYPDATFKNYGDISSDDQAAAKDWQGEDRVVVAKYWEVTIEEQKLLRIGNAQQYTDVFEKDRTPAQMLQPILQERMAERPVVCCYLTNGVELLAKKGKPKKTEWKGSRIPYKACYGRTVYTTNDTTSAIGTNTTGADRIGRVKRMSYVRLARHAQKYYNYLKSSEGERFKMNLLVPYIGYEGQFSPDQLLALQKSVTQPVPVVLVKPTSERTGENVLPLPRREVGTLDVQGYEIAAEAARRDIQNAMGRYSSSVGKSDSNVRSGVLQEQLDKQSDQGSYHFVDAYKAMIAALGEDLEELLPFYDDTADRISTRTASGKVVMQAVNGAPGDDGQPGVMMDLGSHATTVGVGPSFDSERAEASAFADSLIGNKMIDSILGPQKATKLLALAIKLKNVGPLGDEMAEIADPSEQNDPKALQQHLAQAMDQLKKQGAVLEEMHGIIEGKKLEAQNALDKAKIDQDTRIKVAEIQFGSAVAVADIKADLEHSLQLMTTQFQTVQSLVDAHQAQLDRIHDAQAQLEGQAHAAVQAQTPPPLDPNAQPPAPAGQPAQPGA